MNTGSETGSRKNPPWLIVTLIILVVLAVSSGVFAYFRFQTLNQPTPGASPTSATALTETPTVDLTNKSPAQLYQYIMSTPPSLSDPLDGSQAANWDNGPGCQFRQNAFHLTTSPSLPSVICFLHDKFVQDFAFQVQVQFGATTNLDEPQGCAILFRAHIVQQESYAFSMNTQSDFLNQSIYKASLDVYGPTVKELKSWEQGVPNQVHAFNVLTVIALRDQINLYINNQFQQTVTNSTFRGGQIGLIGSSGYDNPLFTGTFDVAFRKMKFWKLSN